MSTALRVEPAGTRGRSTALALTGELDLHTAPVLYPTVGDALADHSTVILDLTGVTFCDSSGLNALIRLRRRAQEAGGRLILVAPPQQMLRLLSITGAARIFTIHDTLAEAWDATPDPGPPPTA